ncbi:ornithine carbamoyltransferase [Helcococcus ovis]|uniref:Ornithine carbamoyltransferase n=1 Tax=Helcococcus ovis TaxID=72026 RepID=A0A4R9C4Q3_9FIRM|nr:ornithine carbamoyltransferase [Helcococcus ovis]TFF65565.1 ornithine carbamoyltransferase [Helcococcus ovis]TFF67669.1 ornithine carbamoyltransferase [Helcococcus ovis]
MPVNLQGRSILGLKFLTEDEIKYLIDLGEQFKKLKITRTPHRYLEGKNIVLLFEKTSTRTRCSFEVAGMDLGMGVTYLDPGSSQMGNKESIEDTAKVLGRFYDGIEYRGFDQALVEKLADNAGVPVWNGLTDEFHPTQMIADMLTIKENFGYLKGLNFVFMGDCRNNVSNSLMVACAKLGLNYTGCGPKELWPDEKLISESKEFAAVHGSKVEFTENVEEACTGAHVIYTDIWVSMGEPEEVWLERIKLLHKYQVNQKVMDYADKNAIFMHCLPSFHDLETSTGVKVNNKFGNQYDLQGMEVKDEVFLGKQSKVFDEAENRMHTIKAIMYATLK